MDAVVTGVRVVRGPDWCYDDQDGGEGHVGTVVLLGGEGEGQVSVVWDTEEDCFSYRCGAEGKYDLRLFDNAQIGTRHPRTACGACHEEDIAGTLWRCVRCSGYFLCSGCYMEGRHCLEHSFLRIDVPEERLLGVHVPMRKKAGVATARGIFPGAVVVRGTHWKWNDQDGFSGNRGTVVGVEGYGALSFRSVASVKWLQNDTSNIYRVGHKGKVDVRCVKAASGGSYYPHHLLPLGAVRQSDDKLLKSGDFVMTELDPETYRIMQEGHGGWSDEMATTIGSVGRICSITGLGDVRVRYSNVGQFLVNPDTLTKTHLQEYLSGDHVRLMTDMKRMKMLQQDHGEWRDGMMRCLGNVGKVIRLLAFDCVEVFVEGFYWTVNTLCLSPVNDSETDNYRSQIREQLRGSYPSPSSAIPGAAILGDTATLQSLLKSSPQLINSKLNGRTALHLAVTEDKIDVVRLLLERGADMESQTDLGDKPLHLTSYCDVPEATELLLAAGADPNPRNKHGYTPLIVAARAGRHRVMRVLLSHPGTDINVTDPEGYTALHSALPGQHTQCIYLLLKANLDPTLLNFHCAAAVVDAAKGGSYPCLDYIASLCPQHLNFHDDEGHTSLHLAARASYYGVLDLLLSTEAVDVNHQANDGSTALHIVADLGHTRSLEAVAVGGAAPDLQDGEGKTALLIVLQDKGMKPPADDSPRTKQILEELLASYNNTTQYIHPYVACACLLVQCGADVHIRSKSGTSPQKIVSPNVMNLMMNYRPGGTGAPALRPQVITQVSIPNRSRGGVSAALRPSVAKTTMPSSQPTPPVLGSAATVDLPEKKPAALQEGETEERMHPEQQSRERLPEAGSLSQLRPAETPEQSLSTSQSTSRTAWFSVPTSTGRMLMRSTDPQVQPASEGLLSAPTDEQVHVTWTQPVQPTTTPPLDRRLSRTASSPAMVRRQQNGTDPTTGERTPVVVSGSLDDVSMEMLDPELALQVQKMSDRLQGMSLSSTSVREERLQELSSMSAEAQEMSDRVSDRLQEMSSQKSARSQDISDRLQELSSMSVRAQEISDKVSGRLQKASSTSNQAQDISDRLQELSIRRSAQSQEISSMSARAQEISSMSEEEQLAMAMSLSIMEDEGSRWKEEEVREEEEEEEDMEDEEEEEEEEVKVKSVQSIALCILCDNLANLKFEPCGDTIMCSECANHTRAKKCPWCKSVIERKVLMAITAPH